jgi:hypothetical protein
MERAIRKAKNPLLPLSGLNTLMEHSTYFGFSQTITIQDTSEDRSLYLEPWILTQVNPVGSLIVPLTEKTEYVNYYEPIDKNLIETKNNRMIITVTGDVRYKLGFKSTVLTGRSAYLGTLDKELGYLFIRNYFNNPSNVYCAAPNANPEQYGCSLFLYNDPGSQGGFSEFENCGTTISGDTGLSRSVDEVYYYFFIGTEKNLLAIADVLL